MKGRGRRAGARVVTRSVAGLAVLMMLGAIAGGAIRGALEDKIPIEWFVALASPAEQGQDRAKAIKGLVKAVEKKNRGIDLSAVIEDADVHVALGERIAAGDVPDLIGPMSMRSFTAFGDSLADLTPLIEAAGYDLTAYDPDLLKAYRDADGRLVGLPFSVYPSLIFFNRDLFDDAGLAYPPRAVGDRYVMPDGTEAEWDLETLAMVAKILTVDANGNDATSPDFDPARIVRFGFVDQFSDFRRTATALGGPGSLISQDASGATSVEMPDGWRDAARWLHDGTWNSHFLPTTAEINGLLLSNNPFGSGRVAMALAPLWYTCCIADQKGELLSSWDVGVIPVGLTGTTTSPLDTTVIGIGATTAHPEESFAVLEFLLAGGGTRALRQDAPPTAEGRRQWTRHQDRFYEGERDWAALSAMLGYGDVPSHLEDLPAYDAVQQRLAEFRHGLGTEEMADIDLDAEIDALLQDLRTLADTG